MTNGKEDDGKSKKMTPADFLGLTIGITNKQKDSANRDVEKYNTDAADARAKSSEKRLLILRIIDRIRNL